MNVALIPARGGSKSIPLKNIKNICDKPLVYWTIKAACDCKHVDKVYVATDSKEIKTTVNTFGFSKVQVIDRSDDCSTDIASTESVMLEFAQKFEFDNIALIQATSPLLTSDDLCKGFETFYTPGTDSVISVVHQKRFHWENDKNGYAHSINYDIFARPRRQDFSGYFVENGAFYITKREDLLKYRNRISGNIKVFVMNDDTFFELDEPRDWLIIEALMKKRGLDKMNTQGFVLFPDIKMFLTDCDGCLTDGGMYYSENGDELKKFNTRDGMGFQLLHKKGILTGIITSEDVKLLKKRAHKLNLDILQMGIKDKIGAVEVLCKKYNLLLENVAYIGDDINDVEVIHKVGFGCSVKNGTKEAIAVAKYVTKVDGGDGAIREVAEYILNMGKE